MCSTSACERTHPSNEVFLIFLHDSLRHRVRGVRIKSCAGYGAAGEVPSCHSCLPLCPTLSHLLLAAGPTSAIPLTAIGNCWRIEISDCTKFFSECQKTVHPERKRCFPAATEPGVAMRSASIRGSVDLAWLPGLGRCRRLPAWRRHILSATHPAHALSASVAPPHAFPVGL